MAQRDPWLCDCADPNCAAVSERSRPFLVVFSFLTAGYTEHNGDFRKANFNGLPTLVEVLAKQSDNARIDIAARCLHKVVPLLISVSGSTYPLELIEARVQAILDDVLAAVPPELREGYVPPADEGYVPPAEALGEAKLPDPNVLADPTA